MEAVIRTALPVTFRLSGPPDDPEAHALRDEMEARLVAPLLKHACEALQPPRPLPWYPQRLAWQFDVSRAALRGKGDQSLASDDLRNLHTWLLQETDLGRVQRQEAASMVPRRRRSTQGCNPVHPGGSPMHQVATPCLQMAALCMQEAALSIQEAGPCVQRGGPLCVGAAAAARRAARPRRARHLREPRLQDPADHRDTARRGAERRRRCRRPRARGGQ